MSSRLQLDVRNLSLWRRHSGERLRGKGRYGVERLECEVLYNKGDI